ncbi:alpha/beta fold hydrolase [Microvirga pudoricolor]|uniref:alpha/beta fold hydrolase n=1 Tax=Microvirga pudoricolor TaxID=2778729 RepID=UPI00194E5BF4|nr:alpha/beta hydrolase [Microvirga pudoricolor]MBM6594336.1 alpha/beta hydrolase [Microvirga pudoricolor]
MTNTVTSPYRDLFVSAADGLRLYARDYGPVAGDALPVVCLSGLSRNSSDFHALALALSQDSRRPRRVLALDYRGRGRSEWSPDWQQYDVRVELNDTSQVLIAAGIEKAVFVGTSRGGLIIMALGALRPDVLAGAVLNDVGPAISPEGLRRIRGYVGKLPQPGTFAEAAEVLRTMSGGQFPNKTGAEWEALARGTWSERDGRLVLSYDPNLMRTLEALDLDAPLPDLWPFFDTLKAIPVMAIRGARSDLLTAETFESMQEAHPGLAAVTVPDQGHAPEFEGELVERVRDFVAGVEAGLAETRAA